MVNGKKIEDYFEKLDNNIYFVREIRSIVKKENLGVKVKGKTHFVPCDTCKTQSILTDFHLKKL